MYILISLFRSFEFQQKIVVNQIAISIKTNDTYLVIKLHQKNFCNLNKKLGTCAYCSEPTLVMRFKQMLDTKYLI